MCECIFVFFCMRVRVLSSARGCVCFFVLECVYERVSMRACV